MTTRTARAPAVAAAPAAAPVVVIGPLPPPMTGAAAITHATATALARGAPVRCASLSPGAARGVRRHGVRGLRTLAALGSLAGARAAGGRLAVIACDGGAGRLYALALIAAARGLGMRVRLHHHSFAYIDRPDRLMRALLAAGGATLGHVFLSEGMRDRFRAAYGPARGAADAVIPNAAFLDPGRSPPERPARTRLEIGHLANLGEAKGLPEMLALARRLAAAGVAARVRLAGPIADPADRAAVEAAAAALGPSRLVWHGPLHGAEKAAFYASLDLFALPTRHRDEAQPAVIHEAAFAGVPSLACARGAIAEQVGDPWLLCAPEAEFVEWATARVMALAGDPARTRALGRAARARAEADAAVGRAALARLAAEVAA